MQTKFFSFTLPPKCKWHQHSNESEYLQTTLVSKNGLLAIGPTTPQRRSRAPHAVTRIANTPDPTSPLLTSFLCLPPEIRMQIYRYLMIYDGMIQYEFCLKTQRLVHREYVSQCLRAKWTRHGIFPSILETCRTIHQEGRFVLYGENGFGITNCKPYYQNQYRWWKTLSSWKIGRANMECMTKLQLRHNEKSTNLYEVNNALQGLAMLPALKDLDLYIFAMYPDEWDWLLQLSSKMLQKLRKLVIEINVRDGWEGRSRAYLLQALNPSKTFETAVVEVYEAPFLARVGISEGKKAQWGLGHVDSDDYGSWLENIRLTIE